MPVDLSGEMAVEVRRKSIGEDPPIDIFLVVITSGQAAWRETFGSAELLNAYLKGVNSALGMLGRYVALQWNIPRGCGQPWGVRWIIHLDKPSLLAPEYLDFDGEVIPPI